MAIGNEIWSIKPYDFWWPRDLTIFTSPRMLAKSDIYL